jgi:hypothetical protein
MFIDQFKEMFLVEEIDHNFCLREPSTQVFNLAHKKVKLITDTDGTYPVHLWRVIYVLACIHTHVAGQAHDSIASIFYKAFKKQEDNEPLVTVEHIFSTIPDEEFVAFIEEVASVLPLSKVISWFRIINDKLIITEDKKEAVKND